MESITREQASEPSWAIKTSHRGTRSRYMLPDSDVQHACGRGRKAGRVIDPGGRPRKGRDLPLVANFTMSLCSDASCEWCWVGVAESVL